MAASNATIVAVGKSGQTYQIDCYVPDAVATQWTFNPSGLAASTSPNYWKAPEAVTIIDVIVVAAPTAVGGILTLSGALYSGKTLRWANQTQATTNRVKLAIPVPAGEQLGVLQF